MTSTCNEVFVDWLDFTIPTHSTDLSSFRDLLASLGMPTEKLGTGYMARTPDDTGVARLTPDVRGVDRVSLSGAVLEYVRSLESGWFDLLSWMAARPLRITRLDAAYDLRVDAPSEIARYRRRFRRQGNKVKVTQRETSIRWMLSPNDQGVETGTLYAGKRGKNQVIARVYDKAHELLEKRGILIEPTLRYEIEVRGTSGKSRNPCLNDLFDPRSIFWEFASPAFLKRPESVPGWSPTDFCTFTVERPPVDPLSRVRALLDQTEFFRSLVRVSQDLPDRDTQLERLVRYELSRALRSEP